MNAGKKADFPESFPRFRIAGRRVTEQRVRSACAGMDGIAFARWRDVSQKSLPIPIQDARPALRRHEEAPLSRSLAKILIQKLGLDIVQGVSYSAVFQ